MWWELSVIDGLHVGLNRADLACDYKEVCLVGIMGASTARPETASNGPTRQGQSKAAGACGGGRMKLQTCGEIEQQWATGRHKLE